jgi:hypothetical protein
MTANRERATADAAAKRLRFMAGATFSGQVLWLGDAPARSYLGSRCTTDGQCEDLLRPHLFQIFDVRGMNWISVTRWAFARHTT